MVLQEVVDGNWQEASQAALKFLVEPRGNRTPDLLNAFYRSPRESTATNVSASNDRGETNGFKAADNRPTPPSGAAMSQRSPRPNVRFQNHSHHVTLQAVGVLASA
jgi:hypothetical protein